jgi:hypothetical protein
MEEPSQKGLQAEREDLATSIERYAAVAAPTGEVREQAERLHRWTRR